MENEEYKVPEQVRNDDVAMWASEEDLLIYSHFYDKGIASQSKTIEQLKADNFFLENEKDGLIQENKKLRDQAKEALDGSQDFAEDFALGLLNYSMNRTWHTMTEEQRTRSKKLLEEYRKGL